MAKQIYVNLPVKNLPRSKAFFEELNFEFNAEFTDDNAACLIVDENIYVMLLAEHFFKAFTTKEICDAKKCTEVMICLSCDSRSEVDDMVARAASAGGNVPRQVQDQGFMYSHAFEDLDGHIWELVAMEQQGAH
jgi:predicted lactoylglutathione lyase